MTLGPQKLLKCLNDSFMANAVTTRKVSLYIKLATSSLSEGVPDARFSHVKHQMLLIQNSERNDSFDGFSL